MARLSAFSAVNYSALLGLLTIFFLSGFGHPSAIAQSVNESAKTNTIPIDEFSRGVQAVKDKNFQLAVNLFETAAHRSEYEAQYNLAYLLGMEKADRRIMQMLYIGYYLHNLAALSRLRSWRRK